MMLVYQIIEVIKPKITIFTMKLVLRNPEYINIYQNVLKGLEKNYQ